MSWVKIESSAYEAMIELLPKPLSKDIAAADLGCLVARLEDLGIPIPGPRALGRRWGWSHETVRRLISSVSQPRATREPLVSQPRATREPLQDGSSVVLPDNRANREPLVSQPRATREPLVSHTTEINEEESIIKSALDIRYKIKNIEEEVIKNTAARPVFSDEPDEAAGAFTQRTRLKNPSKNKAEYAASLDTHPEYLEKDWMIPILNEFCAWYWREESPTNQNPPMKIILVWEQWVRHKWMDGALGITDLISWLFSKDGEWWRSAGHTVADCIWGIDRIEERINAAKNAHKDTAMSLSDLHERRKDRYRRYMEQNGIEYSAPNSNEGNHVEHV